MHGHNYENQKTLRSPKPRLINDKSFTSRVTNDIPAFRGAESADTNYQENVCSSGMDPKSGAYSKDSFEEVKVETAETRNSSPLAFPFEHTPSGNLKIIPNQVVYESQKVCVLVANPKKTKINVTNGNDWFQSPDLKMNEMTKYCQRKDLNDEMLSATQNFMMCDHFLPPRNGSTRVPNRDEKQQVREKQGGGEGLNTVNSESLNKFTDDESEGGISSCYPPADNKIEWSKVTLPAKTHLLKLLEDRITNHVNPDIIVCVENEQFNCHLLVLQCYSSFFEKKCEKMVKLPQNKVTSLAFSIIYNWMILSEQDNYILLRRDNILEIFIASQFLGINELEEQCRAFIESPTIFSEATAFMLYLDARRMNEMEVAEMMLPRVTTIFLTIVASQDFLHLSVEDLCALISSNYIQISCEMQIFMSAVRWLMHDWNARAGLLKEVMRCIRFGWIVPWQLVDIRRNPVNPEFIQVTSNPEVAQMVEDGVAFAIVHYCYGKAKEDECYAWVKDLKIPQQRNWDSKKKEYRTYQEFLDELDSISKSMEKKHKQIKRKCYMNSNEQIGEYNIIQSSNQLVGRNRAFLENSRNQDNGRICRPLVTDEPLPRETGIRENEPEHIFRQNIENGRKISNINGLRDEYYKIANNRDHPQMYQYSTDLHSSRTTHNLVKPPTGLLNKEEKNNTLRMN